MTTTRKVNDHHDKGNNRHAGCSIKERLAQGKKLKELISKDGLLGQLTYA